MMIVVRKRTVGALVTVLILMGLLVLSSLLWACGSNHTRYTGAPSGSGYRDDIIEQRVRAVRVDFECWGRKYSSSGVVLGSNHVMTSLHAFPLECPETEIWVTNYLGKHYRAYVAAISREHDGLVLGIVSRLLKFHRVRHGDRPKSGDVVCFTAAHPEVHRGCGVVDILGTGPLSVKFGAEAVRGNSGSGVYNQAGELVGLVAGSCRDAGCGYSAGPAMIDIMNTLEEY